jgi:transcriptional regulator with XRE-family HTH domain
MNLGHDRMTDQQSASFGDYLRTRRAERGYSARHDARETGVTTTTITRYEDGTYLVPAPDLLLALVDVLELDITIAVALIDPYRRLWQQLIEHQEGQRS